ncbi:hypothetical protein WR25_14354 [Diploscapter pachys]|uniref:SUN domain-containing protein n=1 Tax=Diploscapter pachys TaxID=2018661 RepID=A0A2A2J303_9BILA|nr:hypothetical protein WR25_14354 [Diploscapter pachys]
MDSIRRLCRVAECRWLQPLEWSVAKMAAIAVAIILLLWSVGLYNYRPISLVTSSVSGRQEEKQRVPTELERIADVGRRKDARLVGRTYSDDINGGYRFLQFVYRFQIGASGIQRLSDLDEEDDAVHRHVSIKENKFVQRKETNWTTNFSRSEPAPLYRLENVAALHRGAFVIPEHSASLPQNNFFYDIFGFNQRNKNSYQALLNRCNFAGSECDEQNPLAKCRYVEVDGGVRQVCYPSDDPLDSPPVSTIRLRVTSNYGRKWTCLYSIAVLAAPT